MGKGGKGNGEIVKVEEGSVEPCSFVISEVPAEVLKEWDRHEFNIKGPSGLKDEAKVVLTLINEDGSRILVTFPLWAGFNGPSGTFSVEHGDSSANKRQLQPF